MAARAASGSRKARAKPIHRSRPVPGAAPIARIRSRGTAVRDREHARDHRLVEAEGVADDLAVEIHLGHLTREIRLLDEAEVAPGRVLLALRDDELAVGQVAHHGADLQFQGLEGRDPSATVDDVVAALIVRRMPHQHRHLLAILLQGGHQRLLLGIAAETVGKTRPVDQVGGNLDDGIGPHLGKGLADGADGPAAAAGGQGRGSVRGRLFRRRIGHQAREEVLACHASSFICPMRPAPVPRSPR